MMSAERLLLGLCLTLLWAGTLEAAQPRGEARCGSLSRHASGIPAGPFDYRRSPDHQGNKGAEAAVAEAGGGEDGAPAVAQLDYTLRQYPNHLRALLTMAEVAEKQNTDRPRGSRYPMGCWFDRALRFAPKDTEVRLAYGYWLAKKGERAAAVAELDRLEKEARDSDVLSYNLGLAYCEAGAFDKALAAAHRAYGLGYTQPGLRNRLIRAGKWKDPHPRPGPASGATVSTSAAPVPE